MFDAALLGRAAAHLKDARDTIERVRQKAADYPTEGFDEIAEELVTFTNDIDLIISKMDRLASKGEI